jgi:uncharacterized protein (TIGR02996 family)
MNTRELLLEAIRMAPASNMPRILYADWLTEFGECDHDTATAEFIKLSCPVVMPPRGVMPQEAREWLACHWQRLVPSLASVFFTNGACAQYLHGCGRLIELMVPIPVPTKNRIAWYRADLNFDRGFLRVAKLFSPFSHGYLLESILKDQPLADVPMLWRQDNLTRGFKSGRAKDV